MRITTLLLSLCLMSSLSAQTETQDKVLPQAPVWNQYLDIEQFWHAYADTKGGITWGQSSQYPDYDKVKEGDLFMVELEQGLCLMEFFHSRWRRANDVRRWDESVNEYGGCPYVFD